MRVRPRGGSSCVNNMKQIGLAIANYESSKGVYPPSSTDELLVWDDGGRLAQSQLGESHSALF